ncbi:52 kDa repressor of the inhibitor of the protein kinase-like [Aphis gossypii]|uniref:52 kDa repressor of the inhibitor of the protein kinase-like n=1 Tax=Aphis gossypii TaxID=80765 RepID=UPI002159B38A|nr:52 kDa repressor of the inhibitor of the protein kinase-like [Aphis gossypii]
MSVLKSQQFLSIIFDHKQPSVIERIDTDKLAKIKENRKRLVPIIQCILLCGREEIPLRGHLDFGKIVVDDINSREGKFRAILKYRAIGDEHLKNVLEGCGKRNKYTSPIIQNQIIEACNKIILKQIVDKVNSSKCFSILADETTDVATKEQLSLSVRYVDDDDLLHEDFLQFFEINSLTGSSLASSILNGLNDCGIDCNHLYGQGYDGASNMAGKFNGWCPSFN